MVIITPLYSHSTPTLILYLLLLSTTTPTPSFSFNLTAILSPFPDLSRFSSLLLSTAVYDDLSTVTSLSLLALPNSLLSSPPNNIADILRYHVLLQFLSPSDLRHLPPSGRLISTLLTTQSNSVPASVNITRDTDTNLINIAPSDNEASNITVTSCVKSIPYNVSIYIVNAMLIPTSVDIMASESQPLLGLNVTKALIDGHDFNVAASMLQASGVSDELESDETGAGITLFIPTDDSFADLLPTVKIQSLTADKKAVLLKFHVLHSYYPLGSLESIVNPVQPTLATELVGAGDYTLNISRVNGSVAINTGLIQASVTQTVFDEKPIAIFGINSVLLPKEIFGNIPIKMTTPLLTTLPGVVVPPETKTEFESPTQLPVVDGSGATRRVGLGRYIVSMYCTILVFLFLLV
ncbi:fasciclin-like arabinogalactan protein 4 [Heracleum sosnowskyi]|uniref:Fasciclin-like arabinogalactan protein 4 n=1 Tax=Heracleum sosnowskyi TaxID=360622 RepID=A0AAD8J255_9APIA|nr:fasciclin-like arabinogalactan protein 4 [Heracleum sosnowskyi]